MITLTPRAANQLRSMLAGLETPASRVRLVVEEGGCSGMQYGMSFDEHKQGDAAFESEGLGIVVDSKSLSHLDGSLVDFDDGLHGKGFEIKNPNAHATCGCGKSFN
jgi:iron-sulfur cluster assembly protein/iron-sulfur cluster insertion protein